MKCTRCKKNIATIHIQDMGQHLSNVLVCAKREENTIAI